jgi:carboxyl-terminal processing protease
MLAAAAFGASALTPEQRRLNLDSFEYVWKTVRDKHWDPKLGGVDWQAAHDELRPRIEAAQTMEEARQIVASMLERLHQTHFGVIPADAYETIDSKGDSTPSDHGQTGIDLRILDGRAIVISVAPDSSAHERGVAPGWELVRIGKTETAPLIRTIVKGAGSSRMTEMMTARALRAKLDGPIGSEVTAEFSDINGKAVSKHLARRVESGELTSFGFLPPMVVNFDSRKLPSGVEYIRFNLFLKPDRVVTRFGEAIHECGHCPGVVVDLRGNPGGIGAMAMGMAGFLISHPDQKLGTMYMRTLPIRFVIFPRPEVYEGPVAILVDGFTASTSEIFAEGLQDLKRARVFGERTAGAALPSQVERLPNGDGFQYAMANYVSESGRQLEGNGVIPDVEVALDRRSLADGRDPVLDAALDWLKHAGEKKEGL